MNGLLIDYDYCFGCHTCEAACKTEHGFGEGQWGIKLHEYGPTEYEPGKWEYTFVPVPTKLCDLCAERVEEGRLPTCVHHCQAKCMEWGPVEELAKKQALKPNVVVFSIDPNWVNPESPAKYNAEQDARQGVGGHVSAEAKAVDLSAEEIAAMSNATQAKIF